MIRTIAIGVSSYSYLYIIQLWADYLANPESFFYIDLGLLI